MTLIKLAKKVLEDKKLIQAYIESGRNDERLKAEIKRRGIKFVNPFLK